MVSLVLTVCLAMQTDVCAQRLLPVATVETQAQCQASAVERLAAWQARHPQFVASEWSCKTPDLSPLAVKEVAPGIWVHKGLNEIPSPENASDLANIGFVIGEEAVAVIDAGGSRLVAERLLLAIREKTDLPIRWLVLSHMHPDHVMGASLFVDAGVPVVGSPTLPAALQARAETYEANYDRLIGPQQMILSQVIDPEGITTDVSQLDLGKRRLLLSAHPTAHTNNDLTVYDPNSKTIWMADLVFAQHIPALDGSIRGWISVLDEMRPFDARRLVPGHGPASLPWPEGMQATYDYLTALAGEVKEAIDSGESLGSAVTHVGEDLRGNWMLFDEFNARNVTAAFAELEWE